MGTTPNLGLPYPENTDPLAGTPAAIQALAEAVDSAHPKTWKAQANSPSTDGSGDITVTHGLGAAPTAVFVTLVSNTVNWNLAVHSITSTTFKVRVRTANTAAALGSGVTVPIHWLAFA